MKMEETISPENWISFFHLNSEILAKLFNLIYYLILTLTITLSTSAYLKLLTVNPT